MTIEGEPRLLQLSIPQNLAAQCGDIFAVPVYISPTKSSSVFMYRLNVKYDPDVIQYLAASTTNTLTQSAWAGPRDRLFTIDGASKPNLVRIGDMTMSVPLSTTDTARLVSLLFRAVYNQSGSVTTPLEFVPEFSSHGRTYRTSFNTYVDSEPGDVQISYVDGKALINGGGAIPSQPPGGTHLEQNAPNPFNPSTVIEFTLGSETDVRLTVYDILGRPVKILVDEYRKAGRYRVRFDASGLPSGIYLYKLETAEYSAVRRMMLSK
jgi:hypothetical protein